MAGAGIASTSEIGIEDFGLINPAVLSTNSELVFSGGYAKGESHDQKYSGYSLSLLDSTNGAWDSKHTELVPSGFPIASILYYSNLNLTQFEDQFFQLGLSQPLSPKMSLGLSVNYSMLESKTFNSRENVFDVGAGLLWKALNRLTFGVSAMNLLDKRNEEIPGYLRRSLGVGIEFLATQTIKLRADIWRVREGTSTCTVGCGTTPAHGNETESVYRFGVSNQITEGFILQFGFADDQSINSKIIAAGFILAGPKLSLSYSFNRETSYNDVLHSVDIRIPVW